MEHITTLIHLKVRTIINSVKRIKNRSPYELPVLILFLLLAGTGLYIFFYHSFKFFRGHEPFGSLLIDQSFYLFNMALFVMLMISSGTSAFTSMFRSKETVFLATQPVYWKEIYFIKLLESIWLSSWSFFFVVIPFMIAYGIHKEVEPVFFSMLCLCFYLPMVVLAGTLGTIIATFTVWFLPDKRRRKIALITLIVGIAWWMMKTHPEFVKEQGSISGILTGYLPNVSFAQNAFLPSFWVTKGILILGASHTQQALDFNDGLFYFGLLLSNAMFFFIPALSIANRLYPATYLKLQDYGDADAVKKRLVNSRLETLFDKVAWPSRASMGFLEKDIKTFVRDPSEWSQLIIFFGLLLLYFSNLKNLEFHVLVDFWRNMVFVLNTVGTYIVLSSFSMRFVFPMISLEGARAWMIGVAPIRFTSVLLVKLVLGTFVSMLLTLPLVFFSGWMLDISLGKLFYTLVLGFFVCVALTGLSVGFGARFPNFKSNNPSEIISGFGGSMLLITHLIYLGGIGVFLLTNENPHWLAFLMVATGSLLVGMIPIRVGANALRRMEF